MGSFKVEQIERVWEWVGIFGGKTYFLQVKVQVLLEVSELMGTCFKVREAYSVFFKEKLGRDGLRTGGARTQAKTQTGQKFLKQVKGAREAGKRTVVSGGKRKRKKNDNFCFFFVQERLCWFWFCIFSGSGCYWLLTAHSPFLSSLTGWLKSTDLLMLFF